ncbi:hypothetical protein ACFXC8_56175 [Streptomyces sp. NPDC059441]|uniref:hypothetical protein n=1 Tax=Streptomyces sp. NPDC059441 TaxID=3346829 RepID=UPI0036772955
MKLRTPARLAASAALALSVAAGATVATAATASAAVGKSACTESVKLATTTTTTVKFRTGPGTKYTAKGQLSTNTSGYWACNKGSTGSSKSWGYIQVKSGAHKGEWGWVSSRYLTVPMNLD